MGEKGKVWEDPILSMAGLCPGPSDKQSSDTLCRSVRQAAGGVGAAVSLGEAETMSEVPERSAVGARVRRSVF